MYHLTQYDHLNTRLATGKPDTYAIVPNPNAKDAGQLVLVNQRRMYSLVEFALLLEHCSTSQLWTQKDFPHQLLIQFSTDGDVLFAFQQHAGGPLITSESNEYTIKIIAFADTHDEDRVPFTLCAHCVNMGGVKKRASGAALCYPQLVPLWHDDMMELIASQESAEVSVRRSTDDRFDIDDQSHRW